MILWGISDLVQAQRIWKRIKWTHHGPFQLPENTTDSGTYTPNGMGWAEMLHFSSDGTLYASGNSGGLYRLDTKQMKWAAMQGSPEMLGVLDMTSDPLHPERLFLATGNTAWDDDWGTGIWRSSNGGKTWNLTSLHFVPADKRPLWQIEAAPGDFTRQIALSENEIFVSIDAWKSHRKVFERPQTAFRTLRFAPGQDQICYAAGAVLLRSDDGGENWTDLTSGLSASDKGRTQYRRIAISVCPLAPNALWAMYAANGRVYLDKSEDYGNSWRQVSVQRIIQRFDENHAELQVAPDDTAVIYAGAVRLFRSDDAGKSFRQITFPVWKHAQFQHDDIRELLVLPGGKVYTGNDGGVGYSANNGASWTDLSGNGLCLTQFYGIALNKEGTELMGGCQDVGNMHYDVQKRHWSNISELYGDGGEVAHDKGSWIITQNGTLFESETNGKTWKLVSGQKYISRMWMPMAFDAKGKYFYTTDHSIFRLAKNGIAQDIGTGLQRSEHKIWAFAQHQSTPDRAWIAFDQPVWSSKTEDLKGKLYRCDHLMDSVPEWKDITSNLGILAWRSITSIALDPNNPDVIWVCFKIFDAKDQEPHRVYLSRDAGETWENISSGLPNLRANVLRYIDAGDGILLLGTDAGIYARRWYDPEWVLLEGKKSISACMISDIEWNEASKTLWVASYGNGIWSARLPRKLLR